MSQQQGSHRGGGSSLSALVSTLVPSFLVTVVLVSVFLVLRNKQRRLYAPRTCHEALLEEYVVRIQLTMLCANSCS
jgi:hypothetical protein